MGGRACLTQSRHVEPKSYYVVGNGIFGGRQQQSTFFPWENNNPDSNRTIPQVNLVGCSVRAN